MLDFLWVLAEVFVVIILILGLVLIGTSLAVHLLDKYLAHRDDTRRNRRNAKKALNKRIKSHAFFRPGDYMDD